MVQRDDDDRRPEGNPLRRSREPAERDERVVDAPIWIRRVRGDDDVLGRPHGVEPELLREPGDGADARRIRFTAEVGQDDSKMHAASVLRERVADSRVARLATTDPDGRPHLVPIVFALAGDTLYSAVDAKPKRSRALRRIENARRRPDAVTVLVDRYDDDDWNELWWVRLRGRARVLDEGEEADHALELLTAKYAQYRDAPPAQPVLAIDVDEWRWWSADRSLAFGTAQENND